jgi:hypothetical protein
MSAQAHWESIYSSKAPDAVSWYRPHLEVSLDRMRQSIPSVQAALLMMH